MRILITSGPTREPIDDVRFVSNVSTGRLGVHLARACLEAGHDVVFLRGPGALALDASSDDTGATGARASYRQVDFESAQSLLDALRAELLAKDAPVALIHSAAVADYAPRKVEGKLKSDRPELVIEMLPTPKIADAVRKLRSDLVMILFKLESGISREELHSRARKTASRAGADAIVANLLEEVTATAHRADLLRGDGTSTTFESRDAIARGIVAEIERLVAVRSTNGARA